MPLDIFNQQNAKVFSCEMMNIFQNTKVFHHTNNHQMEQSQRNVDKI